jgi:hypothetical protein
MACTSELFPEILKYIRENKGKISFGQARRAVRSQLNKETLERENGLLLCCTHHRADYDETGKSEQCLQCKKEYGIKYLSDPKTGDMAYKRYVEARDLGSFEFDESGNPVKKKRGRPRKNKEDGETSKSTKKAKKSKKSAKKGRRLPKKGREGSSIPFEDGTKLVSVNYKGKRAMAEVKDGMLIYDGTEYASLTQASNQAALDVTGKKVGTSGTRFWHPEGSEQNKNIKWQKEPIIDDPKGKPKRGRKPK